MSRLAIAIGTTLAVHVIAAAVIDALGVTSREPPRKKPTVSVVDLERGAIVAPPAPEPEPMELPPEVPPPAIAPSEPVQPERRRTAARATTQPQNRSETHEPAQPADPAATPGGGREPYRLPDNPSDGPGPKAAHGQRPTRPAGGDGGSGGGSGGGGGGGEGAGAGPPQVFSLADIKTPARPKGNYDYFDAGKNYPAEARQLGVEGIIKAKLIVDDTGKVTKVTLVKKLGHGLDELALARARALEFEPARAADGRAVASIVIWEFTFTLPR